MERGSKMSAPSTSGLSVIESYCYELSTLNKVYFTLLYFRDMAKNTKKVSAHMHKLLALKLVAL